MHFWHTEVGIVQEELMELADTTIRRTDVHTARALGLMRTLTEQQTITVVYLFEHSCFIKITEQDGAGTVTVYPNDAELAQLSIEQARLLITQAASMKLTIHRGRFIQFDRPARMDIYVSRHRGLILTMSLEEVDDDHPLGFDTQEAFGVSARDFMEFGPPS